MIGQTIGQYRILGQLGAGGMGVVYQARDTRLGRTVALKFLPHYLNYDEKAKQRFMKEAQAASVLNHPNVCTIHDIQEHEQQPFIVMEYIEGETIKDRIRGGALDVKDALDVAVQVASGLQAAHENGIIHRDIKPANVMINSRGQAKIMDFGTAKLKDSEELTRTGSTVGTAAYMAPEQTQGDRVDHRVDLWSFGVLLYEMLTGKRPFRGDYTSALMYAILHLEPEEPESMPDELWTITRRLLQKEPKNRYPDVHTMLMDLRSAYSGSFEGGMIAESTYERPPYRTEQNPLARYLYLKAEIKRLDEELKELQPQVLDALWEAPDNRSTLLDHELSIGSRKSYKYSEQVKELQEAVRELKKIEELDGTATVVRHTSYILTRRVKG